jgi:hypothetical protein
LKYTSRLFLVLSISVLGIVVLANTQKSATALSIQRNVHLALGLVRYPQLNRAEQKTILNEISASSPEFFAAIKNHAAVKNTGEYTLGPLEELFAGNDTVEEALLRNYNIVATLAMSQRKAAFRSATSQKRSELWRTHLALILVKRPALNELQQETVLDAMALATPDWFEVRSGKGAEKSEVDAGLRSLEQRIVAAFSKEERVVIFATLGGEGAQCASRLAQRSTVLPIAVNYIETINSSILTRRANNGLAWQDLELERPACQCSTESDWCPVFGRCRGSGCSVTTSGCGTFWSHPCNASSCDGDEKPTPSPTPSPKSSPKSSPSNQI